MVVGIFLRNDLSKIAEYVCCFFYLYYERLKSKLIAKVATDNPKQVSVALDGWSENHAGVLDSLEI